MNISKTADEYKNLVSTYSWLVDSELAKIEKISKEHPEAMPVESLPKLISLVNVVGYLRGQDGAFIDVRPDGVADFQNELYENEDSFEKRLHEIIESVCLNEQSQQKYRFLLEQYYIKARLPKLK